MDLGYKPYGQLGDGTTTDRATPAQIGTATTWRSSMRVSPTWSPPAPTAPCGPGASTRTASSATAPPPTGPRPTQIGTATNWSTVSAGYDHTVATRTDGTLWAWGDNIDGQLGDGTDHQPPRAHPDRHRHQLEHHQRWVFAHDRHPHRWHPVGLGQQHRRPARRRHHDPPTHCPPRSAPPPTGTPSAAGVPTTRSPSAPTAPCGPGATTASAQLGDGTTTNRYAPTQIGTATTWKTISAGDDHTVATRSDGTLWAWGDNGFGQLGDGTTTDRLTPTQIGTATNWKTITAGRFHDTAATRSDGTLWAWGDNAYGQLGDGTTTDRTSPTQIGAATTWAAPRHGWSAVSAGDKPHRGGARRRHAVGLGLQRLRRSSATAPPPTAPHR